MGDRLTDAQLVERLRLIRQYGSTSKAAAIIGLKETAFKEARRQAQARGLTADTVINDEAAGLKQRIAELEEQLAARAREEESAASIRETIYNLPRFEGPAPEWLAEERPPGLPGVPMSMWSDWHYNEVVDPDQMGGLNEFDQDIADERIDRLVNRMVDLSMHHMVNPDYPGAVVFLGGDMISGDIHPELQDTNDDYQQRANLRLQKKLISAMEYLADTFGAVHFVCVPGNHGRSTLKPRFKGRVFESLEWNLYHQLKLYFEAKGDSRITIQVPNEVDAHCNVLGHRFMLTHGDTLGVKGGDGIIGALGPIARGTFKVGRSEAQVGRDFDTLVMGHWHTYIPRGEAVPVIVNGTLKGYDEFARLALRVPYSRPSQALWFVHALGVTAQWQIFLDKKRKANADVPWLTIPPKR